MLTFLRKYQRYFFFVITIVIVISFSFFGTYSISSELSHKKKDFSIGQAVDGSELSFQEISDFSRFLSSDHTTILPAAANREANLLNDGVIYKDLIRNKFIYKLFVAYKPFIEKELQQKLDRVKSYQFYVHPVANFISAKLCWQRMKPDLIQTVDEMQRVQTIDEAVFANYLDIYEKQMEVSPEWIKKILVLQQRQYPTLNFDQQVLYQNFSLFGFTSLDDWLGKNFIDLAAQFIWNMGILAEQKGYKVSEKEAYFSLINNVKEGIEKYFQQEAKKGFEEDVFHHQLRKLGMEEKRALAIWSKVLAFRKMLKSETQQILVDPLVFDSYNQFAKKEVRVKTYSLPSYMQFKDFAHFLSYLMYKRANEEDIENMKVMYPELLETRVLLGIKKTDIAHAGLSVAEKRLWHWQLEDANWEKIAATFPELSLPKNTQHGERFKFLEELDMQQRDKIDRFSREQIVVSSGELIDTALKSAKETKKEVYLRYNNPSIELDHLKQSSLLGQYVLGKQNDKLDKYSEDQKTFYSINVLEEKEEYQPLFFEKALNDGTLEQVLTRVLKNYFDHLTDSEMSKLHITEKSDAAFAQAKEAIGALYFKESLAEVDQKYQQSGGKIDWALGEGPTSFYVNEYLYDFMNSARSHLMNQSTDEVSIGTSDAFAFEDQWKLRQEDQIITRENKEHPLATVVFAKTKPAEWSNIIKEKEAIFYFYRIIEEKISDKMSSFEMYDIVDGLGKEKCFALCDEWLNAINEKKAIHLPLMPDTE